LTSRYSNSPGDCYGIHNRPIELHLTRQLKKNLPSLLPIQCRLPATTQPSASTECTSHNRSHSTSTDTISPPTDPKVNDKMAEPKKPQDDKKPRTRSTRKKAESSNQPRVVGKGKEVRNRPQRQPVDLISKLLQGINLGGTKKNVQKIEEKLGIPWDMHSGPDCWHWQENDDHPP
jgi:hypothetical protein